MPQAQAVPALDPRKLPALLTIREVAAALRVDASTVWRMTKDGRIRAVQLGGLGASVRIPAAELKRVLEGAPPTEGG